MAQVIQLILRGIQFLCTLIIMSLVGNMIAEAFAGNPALINYIMFVSVFSMLSLFYLIAICFKEQFTFHKFVPATLDLLNVLFFFCGAVALAAKLGVHSCSNEDYLRSNYITNGSFNMQKRCREAQANDFFLWIGFAAYVASLVLGLFSSGGVNMRGPRRGPAMSQV